MRIATTGVAIILASCAARSARASENPGYLGPYSVEIVNEYGTALPTFTGPGGTYVLGTLGQRYLVRVRNHSGQRIEVVASVDGRDVLDGRPAAWGKRGYVVNAYDELAIDGYRVSTESVAAFRFSSVPRSYAAQLGSAREVGVIGVAIFPERLPVPYWPAPLQRDRAVPAPEEKSSGSSEDGLESSVEGGVVGGSVGGRSDPTDEPKDKAAPSAPNSDAMSKRSMPPTRPGLGTEFAEEHTSQVYTVRFDRASSTPAAVLSVRYNDRAGLMALGIDVDGSGRLYTQDSWFRQSAEPFRRNASFAQPPPGWRH